MRNENLDKKYEELSILIDGFLETIHSAPLPDLSNTPESDREFCVEWNEFEKLSLSKRTPSLASHRDFVVHIHCE